MLKYIILTFGIDIRWPKNDLMPLVLHSKTNHWQVFTNSSSSRRSICCLAWHMFGHEKIGYRYTNTIPRTKSAQILCASCARRELFGGRGVRGGGCSGEREKRKKRQKKITREKKREKERKRDVM